MDLYLVQNLQLYSNRKLKYSLEWIHSSTRGSTQEDRSLPALLIFSVACSLVKAYGVAYIYSTGPPLLVFLLGLYRYGSSSRLILERLQGILSDSLALAKFPTFCGSLVGMYTFFQFPVRLLLYKAASIFRFHMQSDRNIAISRLISAFCAAWLSLQLLNKPFGVKGESLKLKVDSAQEINATNGVSPVSEGEFLKEMSIPLAGKTIDLTLFAVTRSLESIVGQLWNRHKLSRVSRGKWTKLETLISHFTDASVFAISSGMIMWAWIYYPSTLPRAYDRWIGGVAQVDQRLIEILREFRTAIDVYGPDAHPNNILEGMCTDYNCPLEWADPSKTIPAPCELVHSGIGPSCSWHAIVRFSRAFKIAIMTYLPLQLLLKIRNPSRKALLRALREAFRSSAFLGAFVALFWTGVCLARTRLGPRLFSPRITPSMWDQGLCIRAGCLLCGWSILIEAARRRQEVAFFVAPKAAATLLPRRYDLKYIWREKAAFSASVAILFTFAHDNPAKVRGMLGPLLHQVLG